MIQHLSTAAIGAPITRLGVSFFPVYLPSNHPPEITTGTSSGIVVRELEDAAVGSLLAVNPTDTPILIIDGEHFLGGKQNRAVNASVLVPARAERTMPVSCLEQGRWGQAQSYERDEVNASPRIRRVIQEGVYDSIQREQTHASDQGRVWSEIADELQSHQAQSSTSAAMESHRQIFRRDKERAAAARELSKLGPLPGQCGIAVSQGRWITAVEIFGARHLLAEHWSALIKSHLMEHPVHTGPPSADIALWVIRRFASMDSQEAPGVGLGTDLRLRDKKRIGRALKYEESLVHGSFWMRQAKAA
ncbi:MAG: hypothetical protein F4Y38_14145 [Gemmatimonadetes bacterium]|nr:hypothetical protein [Gemmatimonadota bacterium]MYG85990.1 hypothetical protein [Gemmatimonadota bacterium]MYJ89145.1 hypothetical protein [Gemmatimonadota bacterium]